MTDTKSKCNFSTVLLFFLLRLSIVVVAIFLLFTYCNRNGDTSMIAFLICAFYAIAIFISNLGFNIIFKPPGIIVLLFFVYPLGVSLFETNHPVLGVLYCILETIEISYFFEKYIQKNDNTY